MIRRIERRKLTIKNKYNIDGSLVVIYLHSRKDKDKTYEALIDLADFDMVNSIEGSWYPHYDRKTDSHYARYTEYIGKNAEGKIENKAHYLHRFILGYDNQSNMRNIIIDHKNHNNLDNRRENLRVTINEKNCKNRSSKNSNNKSGYRNVSQRDGWWVVQLQIDGKNTVLKKFPLDHLDEAGAYAMEMRKKYYGEFAGIS